MMNQLEKFNIDEAASEGISSEEIVLFLSQNTNGFIFQKVIERAHHYSDLAIYYLEASYICEKISALGQTKSFKVDWKSGYHPVAQFIIVPQQLEELNKLIADLCYHLSGDYEDDDEQMLWLDRIEEYRELIGKIKLKFPELADDYFANLINGAYGEYESNYDDPEEFVQNLSKQDPEHIFGFWKCMHSDTIQQEFYVSSESWIIPPQSSLSEILSKYSSFHDVSLTLGNMFSLNGGYYVITGDYVLEISFPALAKAFQCISKVFNEERTFYDQHNWLYNFNIINEVSLSDFAGFVLFTLNGYQIILWDQPRLNFHDINILNRNAAAVFHTTSNLIGLIESVTCDWSKINDELFEELCYDLVYYDPKFDRKTIRKMGKSRSRDGGRDIVVYTASRLGNAPKKFIFQCKFIKNGSSLSASKVLDVSDTIDQYDADGYGVFTTGVIDATLFDKVDAIAKRRNLDVVFNSKYEIERDLASFPQLKNRYFT
ncbi:hypothetical protein AACH28_05365 [Sphingobacterium thalpophilum]|uniref:Uncharacterized protein n=1 Tax=Sphingobacterium thalpophilum TaxID=259 RepID=A0ACD5C575_9SPHI